MGTVIPAKVCRLAGCGLAKAEDTVPRYYDVSPGVLAQMKTRPGRQMESRELPPG